MQEQPESQDPKNSNTYVLNDGGGTEMARLLDQDIIFTQHMGGLLQQRPDFSGIHDILDIACGPGGWVQEVALAHPEVELVGIDINARMINYAQMQLEVQNLKNAHFLVMNALEPLAFPDNSFDLVNARTLIGFMAAEAWPKLLAECFRVTRPGGFIRLTESDNLGITTSPALEKVQRLGTRAWQLAGRAYSPDETGGFLTPRLGRFLREAGYSKIQKTAYAIDFSFGEEAYEVMYHNWQILLKLLQPFLVRMGMITQEEADQLYKQAMEEMYSQNFGGLLYFLSVWGEKPE